MMAGVFFHTPPAHVMNSVKAQWAYQDITYINPDISSNRQLITIYARKTAPALQIRLDFTYLDPSTTVQSRSFPLNVGAPSLIPNLAACFSI